MKNISSYIYPCLFICSSTFSEASLEQNQDNQPAHRQTSMTELQSIKFSQLSDLQFYYSEILKNPKIYCSVSHFLSLAAPQSKRSQEALLVFKEILSATKIRAVIFGNSPPCVVETHNTEDIFKFLESRRTVAITFSQDKLTLRFSYKRIPKESHTDGSITKTIDDYHAVFQMQLIRPELQSSDETHRLHTNIDALDLAWEH